MKKKVFVAADVDPLLIQRLQGDSRIELLYQPVKSEDALAEAVGQSEILVTRYQNRVSQRVLESARSLRLIVQGTSGIDNIDLETALRKNITVIAIPGENANAVAEWVIGSAIVLTRTLTAYDRSIRTAQWLREDCATRRELRGHRLGIVGIGRVGSRVATLAKAFGMQPVAYDPYVEEHRVTRRGARKLESLEELLRCSDILTIHVPLTEETRKMIASPHLELLPEGAIVINASRGAVLDERAALELLKRRHLGGLALDVFDPEPPTDSWPDDPRLILTPHIAGCSRESKESIARMIYERICGFYGWEPLNT